MVVPPEETIDFAANMVREGATVSNKYYSHLIAHYNFDRGVVKPEEGYNELGHVVLAELIQYAARGFALVLDQAIRASGKKAPDVSITAETFMAGLKIPVKWVTRKMDDAADKRLVEAMYDELQGTGKVEETLPEDDRVIKALHRSEVLGIKDESDDDSEAEDEGPTEAELAIEELMEREEEVDKSGYDRHERDENDAPVSLPEKRPQQKPTHYLEKTDQVEDAPSIGAKTAKRLGVVGINTVEDLLAADVEQVAADLDVRYITPQVVKDWQDQALLQCEIPRLRGHDAQFLVGCGYRTKDRVTDANPETLLVDLQAFLLTSEGERLLRVGNEPDLDEVKEWIESAKQVA